MGPGEVRSISLREFSAGGAVKVYVNRSVMAHTQRSPSLPTWLAQCLASRCWLLAGPQYPPVTFLWHHWVPLKSMALQPRQSGSHGASSEPLGVVELRVHSTGFCWPVWEGSPGAWIPPRLCQLTAAALCSSCLRSAHSCSPGEVRTRR